MKYRKYLIFTSILISTLSCLSGCGGGPSRAKIASSLKHDGPPLGKPLVDVYTVPNAIPRHEPLSRIGNRPAYTVFQQRYYVLRSSQGFREKGPASWYGRKWHGRKTANGETYDMYAMTAAHKHLPLPTYLRVTNLENGRHVVVRVNDRGPFWGKRIVDLSYAAAAKLGLLAPGTAWVEIEAIHPKHYRTHPVHATQPLPMIPVNPRRQKPANGPPVISKKPPPEPRLRSPSGHRSIAPIPAKS